LNRVWGNTTVNPVKNALNFRNRGLIQTILDAAVNTTKWKRFAGCLDNNARNYRIFHSIKRVFLAKADGCRVVHDQPSLGMAKPCRFNGSTKIRQGSGFRLAGGMLLQIWF